MLLHDITSVMEVEKSIRRFDNFAFAQYIGAIPQRSASWGAVILFTALILYFLLLRPILGAFLSVNLVVEAVIVGLTLAALTYAGGKIAITRMRHGKETFALLTSWMAYMASPRRLVDLRPWKDKNHRFDIEVSTGF